MVYLRYLIMANKPRIRFRGFTEDWEQRKLGDLYKRVNERNDGTLGRDKWISVAKMYFQDPDKVQSNNLDTRTYVMKKGDIAFEGHPNNEFKFGRFVLNDIGTGIISELFPIYRPITEYDLDFWKYAIQLERVMAPILAKSITSSGNSSNKLDHNHFLNKELLVPNIEEQKKIGTLLSLLSKNITLHQCKLKKLNLAKKSLLQKLFPRNGSQIPGVRFKGFTDAWEQRKLNDFGIATGGTSIESEFVDGGTYKVINIGSYSEESVYNDQGLRVNKTDKTKSRILNKYDLTMILNDKTASGNIIGRVLLIDQDNTYVYNQRTERIEVDTKDFLPMFLYHMLNAPEQRKYIVKASQGNTQIYVNWSTISNIDYMIPQLLLEQEKIANLFSLINKDITLHQRKLERLQEVKKGLLQKMFV